MRVEPVALRSVFFCYPAHFAFLFLFGFWISRNIFKGKPLGLKKPCYFRPTRCQAAYPDLPAQLKQAEQRLREAPSQWMTNPLTGEQKSVTLDHRMINRLLRGALYSRSFFDSRRICRRTN